jgi:FAD:protein FMN transferase
MLALRQRSVAEVVEGVLGTQLRLHVECRTRRSLSWLRTAALRAALHRCEAISKCCNVFDPTSEVRALWSSGIVGAEVRVSGDLGAVMRQSLLMERATQGAYHPMVGRAVRLWQRGVIPTIDESDRLAELCRGAAYEITNDVVVPLVDLDGISFNSLAKGYAADESLRSVVDVLNEHVEDLCAHITIGGDIAVFGGPIRVAIEHPTRAYDNEPPVRVIGLSNSGVATSGAGRKPLLIDGKPHHHVLDPRTCRPVRTIDASVTVVAPSASEADAWSTALTVMGELPATGGVAALLVRSTGEQQATAAFRERFGA